MQQTTMQTLPAGPLTLPIARPKSIIFLAVLTGSAVLFPALAHISGLPVRYILPMHWPVILAGLVYGWRGGLLAGTLSPIISYLLSGMPYPPMIPIMSAELAVYGAGAGFLRESLRLPAFLALGVSLIAGRLAYIVISLLLVPYPGWTLHHALAALAPGLVAGGIQILALPALATWWVRRSSA